MPKSQLRLVAALFAIASLSIAAHASTIAVPVGYVSYDVTGLNVAEFDIANFTGPNASTFPDTTFPITTPVSLTDLSLTVDFAGGGSEVFGPSYFTLASDGLSFNGEQLSTLSTYPTGLLGADEAILTGVFSIPTAQLTLNDGSTQDIVNPGFSVTISDPSGLSDGDLAVISLTATPEPATWTMLGPGLIGLMGMAGATRRKLLAKLRKSGIALSLGLALLLLLPAAMKAQAAVKLSVATVPSTGASGGSVSITGSGFPSGGITPADVSISVASTCGGAGTAASATLVQDVLGSEYKIEFTVPGLSAGTYYVSVSGTTGTSNTFASSNCSTLTIATGVSTTLSIDTTNPTDWVIKNGALTIDFNSEEANIWSIVPTGTQDQLIDFEIPDAGNGENHNNSLFNSGNPLSEFPLPAGWSSANPVGSCPTSTLGCSTAFEPTGFYPINAGFTTVAAVPGYTITPDYIDFWDAYPASGVAPTNTTEYEQHYVVTPNDPGIHIYMSLYHPAQVLNSSNVLVNNGAGTIGGQVQWVIRNNTGQFTNMYAKGADLSMVNGVITPVPTEDDCFSADPGRNDQDATGLDTIDLHPQVGVSNLFNPAGTPGSGIPEGFHRHYCVKYDYSSYEYIHNGHGMFGEKYGDWITFTAGHDTEFDGPMKQNLNFTTPTLITIEPNSDHYRTGGVGTTSIAAGTVGSRIYGPFYMRFNHFGMSTSSNVDGGMILTPDDMFDDALAAAASFTDFYNNESVLISKGYVPTTQRGSVSIQVNGVAGAPRTAWAVLTSPGVNEQNSTAGHEYWADISSTGSATIPNVVPGTYRLSVWDFGQFGEFREDGIIVTANTITTVPTVTFVPENFGAAVWTIGYPDRSSHEFLHGAYAQNFADGPLGYDDREYYGAWNYWNDFAATNGAVIYNATSGPNGAATNNPLAWNYAHWGGFNPGLYGGTCVQADDTTDAYKYTGCSSLGDTIGIPAYVATLAGHAGTNGTTTPTPPWQVHFVTGATAGYNYVDLTLALADSQGKETVTLNGHSLSYTPPSSFDSDAIERSGLTGYYQWVVFEWPVADLNAVGADNVITTQVTGTNSQNADDALRLELSANGAAPSVTGWNDYYFETPKGAAETTVTSNDTVPNP